jgi:SAM-dependent methyltransferase
MDWYHDWQHQAHAESFDGRSRLDRRNLIRNQEGFNDVRLLNERFGWDCQYSLLEVGCATGEFSRYLQLRYPRVRYYGVDISRPAVARAKQKYPEASCFVIDPMASLGEALRACGITEHPELVYAKDVVPHQVRPFAFISELIQVASEAIIMRCRTRDQGKSELDPERSCQYHYDGM